MESKQSVYAQIGGAPAIEAAVDLFYKKVLADDHISRFFEGVDMNRQREKQRRFLTMVTGGPNTYTGRDMRAAHRRLVKDGLDDSHFDHVAAHLGATLRELGVPEALVETVLSVAGSAREDVLNR